jgi:hypothetical protein
MGIVVHRRITSLAVAVLATLAACAVPDQLDETTQDVTTTVTTSQASYVAGQSITVNYMNMPGNMYDWVSVAVAGAPANSYIRYFYTNAAVNGSQVFPGLGVGSYEARAYSNDTFTLLASAPFTVTPAPTITTDQSTYSPGSTVIATWGNMPGNATDFVAISIAGSADTAWVQQVSTGGAVNGSNAFTGLANGNYEARAYLGGTTTVLARHSFSISSVTLSTDSSSYSVGQTVTVSYSGMPGNATDWISVAVYGSADTTYVQWHYTGGAVSGTMQFTGLPGGAYEARAYPKNTYNLLARSPEFVISGSTCTIGSMPVLGSVQSGDLTIAATSQTATAALSVPLTSSILFVSMGEAEPSPQYGAVRCQLLAAGVTCQRGNAGTDNPQSTGAIAIHWTVATFTSGVSVQSGIANTGTNPAIITLSPAVDPASSFVLLTGVLSGGTGWGNNEFAMAQLQSGTSLQISNAVAGETVSYQVVTMTGASVQRGTLAFGSSDVEKTAITTSLPTGALLLTSYTTDNQSGIAASAMMLQSSIANANTLDFKRSQGGSNLNVAWEAVNLPYATHYGVSSFGVGSTSASSAVAGISAASAVAITSSQALLGQGTGSTTYNGALLDLVGEASATLSVGSGTVSLSRATSQASATIPWTVIDFSKNCAGM